MAPTMRHTTALTSTSVALATAESTTRRRDDDQFSPVTADSTPPRLTPTDALAFIPMSLQTSATPSDTPSLASAVPNTPNTPFRSTGDEPTDWLHSTVALSISCWLLIFSIFSFISLLAMWCNGTLDTRLNYYREGRRYRRRTRIVQQLPRYSNSSEENVSMDWREAIAMAPSDMVVDGRVYAPVVREGEVVVRESNGRMWRTMEEAWARELRLQQRMRGAGLM